jgi:signal transduction histidine kinase
MNSAAVPGPVLLDGLEELAQLAMQLCQATAAQVTLGSALAPAVQVGAPSALPLTAQTLAQPGLLQVEDADLPGGLRFYAGVRLGAGLGTLAVLDAAPRRLSEAQAQGLLRLGRQAERLLQQGAEVEALGARLREVHAARDQRDLMVVLAAHDLKNPLASIQANAQFAMAAPGLAAEPREALQDIVVAAEQIQQLTIDFLDTRSDDAGRLVLRVSAVDLVGLARQVATSLRSEARERGQRIEVAAAQDVSVQGDVGILRRALVNLVQNALKYGRVRDVVRVLLRAEGGEAVLEVSDTGPGIPREERARVFAPYARLDRDAATAPDRSRGLGLTFCQLAAEAHGGRIWVADAERGARLCLALPQTEPVRGGR